MPSASSRRRDGWPAITYESVTWSTDADVGAASRAQVRKHKGSYKAAIPARIRGSEVKVSEQAAALADEASAEIARFDAEMGQELAPFAPLLLRSESAASSRIENLTASARAIAEAELLASTSASNAARIVANTRAMTAAIDLSQSLTSDSILAMHDALMRPHDPNIAGRWRIQQVWIGGSHLGPHDADFVPPLHRRVPGAIDDLVAFMERDDVPVVIQAAIAHAQFETIHPFIDGNGRTGRALVHALLRGKGLTRHVTVPVSAGLLVDVGSYFQALEEYRGGDPDPIITQFANASFASTTNARTLITKLRNIRQTWAEQVKARRGSNTWRIADLLITQPVVNAAVIAQHLGIAPNNVYAPLRPLIDSGVIVQIGDGQRGRIWRSDEVLRALDAFAARAGKRHALR